MVTVPPPAENDRAGAAPAGGRPRGSKTPEHRTLPTAAIRIESIDDPRVDAYRNLRDRTLRGESIFVAEGQVLTLRLLASGYAIESLFVADEFADEIAVVLNDRAPLYVSSEKLLLEVVGFPFHRGVLGVGRRGVPLRFHELLARRDRAAPLRLAVCPEITKPENMGLIFRSASALGIDGVLLGERCCDPFSRRCLRVSMGAVLQVPFVKTADLLADLRSLKQSWNVELVGAVLDERAEPLAAVQWSPRTAILFGNEFDGLPSRCLELCDRRVMIPMRAGVDSLNLGVAAGIFLYQLQSQSPAGGSPSDPPAASCD
jgi:tRNA G18 (ribose-2'-O)-methylase SpoU